MDLRFFILCSIVATLAATTGMAGNLKGVYADDGIYGEGPLAVKSFSVSSRFLDAVKHLPEKEENYRRSESSSSPPRPLLIMTPQEAGVYPTVLLQHGFLMKNSFYSQMMNHISSYGFIVVAPQMSFSLFSGSDTTSEIKDAGETLDWFLDNLNKAIAKQVPSVQANLSEVAVVGHSRGGKVAFGLATGVYRPILNISALVGLDPVDGTGEGKQSNPPILKYSPGSLNLECPVLVIGSGYGPLGKTFSPACAPTGVNHVNFFSDSPAPAVHLVADDFGHMDFLDDSLPGVRGWAADHLCKNGASREPLRKFSSGMVVSFLRAALLHKLDQFTDALAALPWPPVQVDAPEIKGSKEDWKQLWLQGHMVASS